MRKVLIDLSPLRQSPPFRRMWVSSLLAGIGGQMGVFAVTLEVYRITQSSVAVGAIGIFVAVPMLAFSMFGGAIADAFDPRRLAAASAAGQFLVACGLWLQAATTADQLWLIYLLVAVQSTLGSVAVPTRRKIMGVLLIPGLMPAALALYLFSMNVGQITGPSVGGVLTGLVGLQACFLIQAAGFAASLIAALRLPATPRGGSRSNFGIGAIKEALAFLRATPIVRSVFLADLSMTVLAVPTALLPALNAERFGGHPQTLGQLSAAVAIGGVVGAMFTGRIGSVTAKGRALFAVCGAWALLVIGFGASWNLWLSTVLLALAGAADLVAVTFAQTLLQDHAPGELRGRVTAVEQIVQMGGPQVGNFRAGIAGSLLGPGLGVISGGAATLAALAALAVWSPLLAQADKAENLQPVGLE